MTTTSTADGASAAARGRRAPPLRGSLQRHGAAAVLSLLVVVGVAGRSPRFPTGGQPGQHRAAPRRSSAIIALGMTFVIITGGIDLSVGSVFALGGVLAAYGVAVGLARPRCCCRWPCAG